MTKAFTAVFLGLTPEEAGEITNHPKWSAGSWSHALDDRNAAQLDAERAREERNREHVRINAEWMAKCEELRKDALRYKWLRDGGREQIDMFNSLWGESLDWAIDSELAKKEGA